MGLKPILRNVFWLIAALRWSHGPEAWAADAAEHSMRAEVLETAVLPPLRLSRFGDAAVTDAALAAAMSNGLKYADLPSIGSGLARASAGEFFGITDRGPNGAAGHGKGALRTFPLPGFCPTIVRFRIVAHQIQPTQFIPLRDARGRPISGLSNVEGDERLYESTTAALPLPLDPDGVDPEAIRVLPNGNFLISEEYSPSILVVSSNGVVLVRYTPTGRPLTNATYPVRAILPAVFAQRRVNKGFENLALSSDGRTACALLQSPLGDESDPRYENGRMIRAVKLDVSDPLAATVTGEYLAPMSPARSFSARQKQSKVSWSDAESLGPDHLLVLERAAGEGRLLVVDFSRATNLLGRKDEAELAFEANEASLEALGVRPAESRRIFSTHETPEIDSDKLEGLALLGPAEIGLMNDNDFGIDENPNGEPSKFWRVRLPALAGWTH